MPGCQYDQLTFLEGSGINNSQSANGVKKAIITYYEKGRYREINPRTYPAEFAKERLLGATENIVKASLGESVILKYPVYDENDNLVGVFEKKGSVAKNISLSSLNKQELIKKFARNANDIKNIGDNKYICKKESTVFYKPISETYPEVLAINELLMLVDYALVLPKDKVAIKHPVYDKTNKLKGVISEEIPNFSDMSESKLSSEKLLAHGFIESLFAAYIRQENDLHSGNFGDNATIFDADKSNYPYIVEKIGHRFFENIWGIPYTDYDFTIDVKVIENAPAPNYGPYFWPTHDYAISVNKRLFPNKDAFQQLAYSNQDNTELHNKKMPYVYTAILRELLVTREDRKKAYSRFIKDDEIINTYLDIMDNRIKQLKRVLIRKHTDFGDYLARNKEILLKKMISHFSLTHFPIEKNVIEQRFQKVLFETNSHALKQEFENILSLKNTFKQYDLSSDTQSNPSIIIDEFYSSLDSELSAISNSNSVTSQDFKHAIDKLFEDVKDKLQPLLKQSSVFNKLKIYKNTIDTIINNINISDEYKTTGTSDLLISIYYENQEDSELNSFVDLGNTNDNIYKKTLMQKIAESIYNFLSNAAPETIKSIFAEGRTYYENRPATYVNSTVSLITLGLSDGSSFVETKENYYKTTIENNKFNMQRFIEIARENAWSPSSQNTYIFDAIFMALKKELRKMDSSKIAEHYPQLSPYSREEIESFNMYAYEKPHNNKINSELIFDKLLILYNKQSSNQNDTASKGKSSIEDELTITAQRQAATCAM